MPNDAGLDQHRGRIDDAANHARRIDRFADRLAGIDGLYMSIFPLATLSIEIPPGETVLCGNDGCAFIEQLRELRCNRRQALRFQSDNYDVDLADASQIVCRFRVYLEFADLAAHADAIFLHRAQVRSAPKQRDVLAGFRQHSAKKSADSAGSDNGK